MRKLVLGCLTLIVLSGCAQTEPLTAPPAVRKERATGGAAKQADGKELSTRIDQLLKQLASTHYRNCLTPNPVKCSDSCSRGTQQLKTRK